MGKAVPQGPLQDEDALIAGALSRDRDAIAALTTRYNRRLFRIARSILRNDDDAEDALQAAYLRAFANLSTFRHESSLGTWLTRIVVNVALGQVRGRRPAIAFDEADISSRLDSVVAFPLAASADPERSIAQRQIGAMLERAIDDLPDSFRTVLVARVLEEMSIEETAAALGITPQTVKTRLHRARRLLREALERQVGSVLLNAFPFDGWRCRRMTALVLRSLGLGP
jgi:RNA polymerase sigma-70 factor, ECF subfamily